MSPTYRFAQLLVLLTFAKCAPAVAAGQDQAQTNPQVVTAKIKVEELSMILVPVSINGSGPYDFLLDTGCTKTIVDQKLADQLGLPRVSEKTIVGVLASAKVSVVRVDSVSVAGVTAAGGEILGSDHAATMMGNVRGVLGEDFLRNFDLLIDYRHESIRLESPLGSMAQTAMGEHLPLQLAGNSHGKPTYNRLVIFGRIPELGNATMSLLLDSGANYLTLFRDNLGPGARETEHIRVGNFNQWDASSAATRRIRSLNLGGNSVSNLTVVALSRRSDVDTDGVIPTSLFRSIFISAHGKFVILNPSFPKTGGPEATDSSWTPKKRVSSAPKEDAGMAENSRDAESDIAFGAFATSTRARRPPAANSGETARATLPIRTIGTPKKAELCRFGSSTRA